MFPINWERLDAGVFTSMLPATRRKSRTFATRETDVISERKHCSGRRRHTQVELSSSRKCADKTQTIARKRWHGARKRKRSNVRSTCGRLKEDERIGTERRHRRSLQSTTANSMVSVSSPTSAPASHATSWSTQRSTRGLGWPLQL